MKRFGVSGNEHILGRNSQHYDQDDAGSNPSEFLVEVNHSISHKRDDIGNESNDEDSRNIGDLMRGRDSTHALSTDNRIYYRPPAKSQK